MRGNKNNGFKKMLYIYGGIILILFITCVIVYTTYNNKLKEATKRSLISTERLENLVPNNLLEEASIELNKGIDEVLAEKKEDATTKSISEELEETNSNSITIEVPTEAPVQEEVKKELEFIYPVEGEIAKEYAREKLVFSETLQEWVAHNGIDIKAERTTVVKATEEGTVKSIKNDPRYGLTVVIEHRDGYKSVYSNLLTTEFVVEGDSVTKGQSLGTVGNSAIFEISDEPHLHFELLKDEEYVDPSIYLKQN